MNDVTTDCNAPWTLDSEFETVTARGERETWALREALDWIAERHIRGGIQEFNQWEEAAREAAGLPTKAEIKAFEDAPDLPTPNAEELAPFVTTEALERAMDRHIVGRLS